MTFMRSPFLSCGRTSSGFSLVETLIVLMIIAGVLGFAVPGFQNKIIAKEVDAASGRLFQDLQLARVDSIRRGVPVVLCPSADGASCQFGGQWRQGWIGFEDLNRDQRRDHTETILLSGPSTTSVSVEWRSPNWLRFSPDGGAWPNGHFRICSNDLSKARAVIIYRTGRVRVDDRSPSGGPVLC